MPPRRTFCSDDCVHEWKIRTQPGYAKRYVAKRDDGICRACGTDCFARFRPIRRLASGLHPRTFLSCFDMNHIVPVSDGGGSCGLDNLETLCRPCHKLVTAAQARARAERRRLASRGKHA